MDDLETATRLWGKIVAPELSRIAPKNGTGFMFWDDADQCVFADLYGDYTPDEKGMLSEALLRTFHELALPYSMRIGFHATEKDASRTMLGWFAGDEAENDEAE